jgi:hypothetical protein
VVPPSPGESPLHPHMKPRVQTLQTNLRVTLVLKKKCGCARPGTSRLPRSVVRQLPPPHPWVTRVPAAPARRAPPAPPLTLARPPFRTAEDYAILEKYFARNDFCRKLQPVWPDLARRLRYCAAAAGEVVTAQGAAITDGPCMYIILEGFVKVYVQDKGGAGHADAQLVTTLRPGSVFGEMGHFMERSATVVADGPCQFVTLTKCVTRERVAVWCTHERVGAAAGGGRLPAALLPVPP